VFRDLETLHKLIKEYCQGKDEEVKVAPKKDKEGGSPQQADPDQQDTLDGGANPEEAPAAKTKSPQKKKNTNNAFKIKHNTFII
jgi:hypothetical protein